MWPKATNVLEEFYYHRRRKRGVGVWGVGGGGEVGWCVCVSRRHFFDWGGGQWYVCAPHF